MSVAYQMLAYNGNTEGLFRATWMFSGNANPVGEVDDPYLQQTFEGVVNNAGCGSAPNPIECLRSVPLENIVNAMNLAPSIFGYTVSTEHAFSVHCACTEQWLTACSN